MSQRIVIETAKRRGERAALCYADSTLKQDELSNRLAYYSAAKVGRAPSYTAILIRTFLCVTAILTLIYAVNRAMEAWLG